MRELSGRPASVEHSREDQMNQNKTRRGNNTKTNKLKISWKSELETLSCGLMSFNNTSILYFLVGFFAPTRHRSCDFLGRFVVPIFEGIAASVGTSNLFLAFSVS